MLDTGCMHFGKITRRHQGDDIRKFVRKIAILPFLQSVSTIIDWRCFGTVPGFFLPLVVWYRTVACPEKLGEGEAGTK